MSRPTARAWGMRERIGRHSRGKPRLLCKYRWQEPVNVADVHSDANWARCHRTRTPTSGGTTAIGNSSIKSYSKTQVVVAKGSGEPELYCVVCASSEALGIVTLLGDSGQRDCRASVGVLANSAMGIVQRRGLNNFSHVEADVLWIEEQQAPRLMPVRKVRGPRIMFFTRPAHCT